MGRRGRPTLGTEALTAKQAKSRFRERRPDTERINTALLRAVRDVGLDPRVADRVVTKAMESFADGPYDLDVVRRALERRLGSPAFPLRPTPSDPSPDIADVPAGASLIKVPICGLSRACEVIAFPPGGLPRLGPLDLTLEPSVQDAPCFGVLGFGEAQTDDDEPIRRRLHICRTREPVGYVLWLASDPDAWFDDPGPEGPAAFIAADEVPCASINATFGVEIPRHELAAAILLYAHVKWADEYGMGYRAGDGVDPPEALPSVGDDKEPCGDEGAKDAEGSSSSFVSIGDSQAQNALRIGPSCEVRVARVARVDYGDVFDAALGGYNIEVQY